MMSVSSVTLLVMVFVVNSLYFKKEVNALFICRPPINQGFKRFRTIKKKWFLTLPYAGENSYEYNGTI